MSEVFYWIGVVHVAAYAVAGIAAASVKFVVWLLEKLRWQREVVRGLAEFYRKRQAEKNGERIVG